MQQFAFFFGIVIGLLVSVETSASDKISADEKGRQAQPNIILINLDDADRELMSPENIAVRYPHLARFVLEGIRFTNFHVTTPLCGPSRASLLRGQYAHKTGFRTNGPEFYRSNRLDGGMQFYHDQGYMSDDLGVWMKNAGYRTMLVGKYLHGGEMPIVPPGWDDFFHYQGANYFGAYRFSNETDPQGSGQVMPLTTYRTELETADAVNAIERHVARNDNKPLFMYLAPLAPHHEAFTSRQLGMVADRYRDWWLDMRMPRSPAINEFDISDKTTALRNVDLFDTTWDQYLESRYRQRVLAVKSVDDMFAQLFSTLEQNGLSENTWIFLTSDNGLMFGHHRLSGKSTSYQQATNVLTYVIGPGVRAGYESRHLLAQIDLAPTLVDIAGGTVPEFVDGKSFKSLLTNPESFVEEDWREALLIEMWESRDYRGKRLRPGSNSIRFFDEVYTEWADGTSEYFDLASDPLQLNNQVEALPDAERQLFSNFLRLKKTLSDEPLVTISEPWEFGELIGRRDAVGGLAIDDNGIANVKLSIRRLSDFYFWNGFRWQADPVRVEAEVTNPGQQMTTWYYRNLPRMQSSDELVGFWARVYDDKGGYNATVPAQILSIDFDRPESNVLSPKPGSVLNNEVTVLGNATDDRQVESVRLVVQNQTDGVFYNGTSWQSDWTYVDVAVEDNGNWAYTLPPFTGVGYVASRGVDSSGNVERTPSISWFTIEP